MRGAIVAIGEGGVIGLGGTLPWHYSDDLRRFKRVTMGAVIVMGRKTWESIGKKALPGRRNIVVSRRGVEGVECHHSIESALAAAGEPCWVIGGAEIYAAALPYCDVLDLTLVPDRVEDPAAVRFPEIDESEWRTVEDAASEADPRLRHVVMERIGKRREPGANV